MRAKALGVDHRTKTIGRTSNGAVPTRAFRLGACGVPSSTVPGSRQRRRESVAVISTRLIQLIEGHTEELTRAVGPF